MHCDSNFQFNQDEQYLVLKTYLPHGASKLYEVESTIYRKIQQDRRSENIVEFYGAFQHGEKYSILLEWADMDSLNNYRLKVPPPIRSFDKAKFWRSCFGLLRALQDLHHHPREIL